MRIIQLLGVFLILFQVTFQGAERVFRPQQVLGMILCNFNDLVRTASGAPIADLVMSVPPYFAEAERRAVMEAAQLAVSDTLSRDIENASPYFSGRRFAWIDQRVSSCGSRIWHVQVCSWRV